jgi:hypothetical protein
MGKKKEKEKEKEKKEKKKEKKKRKCGEEFSFSQLQSLAFFLLFNHHESEY